MIVQVVLAERGDIEVPGGVVVRRDGRCRPPGVGCAGLLGRRGEAPSNDAYTQCQSSRDVHESIAGSSHFSLLLGPNRLSGAELSVTAGTPAKGCARSSLPWVVVGDPQLGGSKRAARTWRLVTLAENDQ